MTNMYNSISITVIPSCTVYRAEYDLMSIDDFFNMETGENILYDLQLLVESENPEVSVPELGEDYNFFQLPMRENSDGTKHIIYRDMTIGMGNDSPTGAYFFETVPEVTAAVMLHRGPFESVDDAFAKVSDWISANEYVIAGLGRCSTVHGPWDRDNPEEFVNEIQIPVQKEE